MTKRFFHCFLAVIICIFTMTSCITITVTEAEPDSKSTDAVFAYTHDPRENPEAMKDIIENPDAVYGFSPDPESQRLGPFADYDWTDPGFVEEVREERRAYHESLDSMTEILYRMRTEGASIEEMARAVSRLRLRLLQKTVFRPFSFGSKRRREDCIFPYVPRGMSVLLPTHHLSPKGMSGLA